MKVAPLYHSEPLKVVIERALAGVPGVVRVTASTTTSTVLVIYDVHTEHAHIVAVVQEVVDDPATYTGRSAPPPHAASRVRARDQWRLFRHQDINAVPRRTTPSAQPWHARPVDEIAAALQTDPAHGIPEAVAAERLQTHGPNTVPPPVPPPPFQLVVNQFKSVPVLLLCGSAILSAATGGVADALVILLVVAGNAGTGLFMELQAQRAIASMLEVGEPLTSVIRDGSVRDVPGQDIVPGDLIPLVRETRVCADARLLDAIDLTVDESMLTGESTSVPKESGDVLPEATPLADRRNMVYRGTVVTGGSGQALVTATGLQTEAGEMQAMALGAERPDTPLETQLERVGNQLVIGAACVCGAVLVAGALHGYPLVEMLRTAVALAVAAIPEGLPAVATTALASGVSSLNRRRVIVRRLRAMDALGNVEIVCLDKTGTLTRNQMTVVEAVAGEASYRLARGRFHPVGRADDAALRELLRVAVLCTEAKAEDSAVRAASPTESALLDAAVAVGLRIDDLKHHNPILELRHRTEARSVMFALHGSVSDGASIAIKGNPLEVLEMCDRQWLDGHEQPMTGAARDRITKENDRLAEDGPRVLGAAFSRTSESTLEHFGTAVWLGLIGMIDPLRDNASTLVAELRHAGIAPIIVTGDQAATAGAIARQLNLNGSGALEIVEWPSEDSFALSTRAAGAQVFARVSPAHKLHVVRAYQGAGHVVAMTGDGVNDSPALKAADIGIVMGQSGSRIARDVADVVLLDDDISAIAVAISEGRRVHANIRKAVHYIIASNLSELVVTFGALAVGLGQPLTARQLLWINLLSDLLPELALALEPVDRHVMRRQPVDPRAPVISRAEYGRLGVQSLTMAGPVLASYATAALRNGAGRASGVAFTALTAAQLLYALLDRSQPPEKESTGFQSQVAPAGCNRVWRAGRRDPGSVAPQAARNGHAVDRRCAARPGHCGHILHAEGATAAHV